MRHGPTPIVPQMIEIDADNRVLLRSRHGQAGSQIKIPEGCAASSTGHAALPPPPSPFPKTPCTALLQQPSPCTAELP